MARMSSAGTHMSIHASGGILQSQKPLSNGKDGRGACACGLMTCNTHEDCGADHLHPGLAIECHMADVGLVLFLCSQE